MNVNTTKRKLEAGELVIGSFVYVPSARLTEIVGLLGFDFVVIDMEHGPVDIGMAEDMVRAAEYAEVTPIIRVSHNTGHLILRALDVGALGIHVPEISQVDEAKDMVASSKYGPQGHRGLAGVRASGYGLKGSMPEYTAAANRETMVIAHIEHIDAANNLDQLLEVEGIDVYYVGPVDLSNSLGVPGKAKDPKVVNCVEDCIKRIVAAGKIAGCIAADVDAARRYTDLGVRYLATHAIAHMAKNSRQFIEDVRA
ncbi:MAG: aldolase/citrate lyase family protein [Fuerstiella sp.]|nr:aldolase/citrate lyase family protein [Fuerstiella sp.]